MEDYIFKGLPVRGAWVCDDTTDDYVDECLKQ